MLSYILSLCLAGSGLGLAYTPSVIAVSLYFEQRRTLATALTFVGGAVGPLLCPILFQAIIDAYGWRGTMLLTAAISLQLCVVGALQRPLPAVPGAAAAGGGIAALLQTRLLRSAKFALYLCDYFCWAAGAFTFFVIVNEFTVSRGISRDSSALLLSVVGVANAAGRLTTALLGNDRRVDCLVAYNVLTAAHGVAATLYLTGSSFTSFVALALVMGFAYGTKLAFLATVTVKLFGIEMLASAYGYGMFAVGAGALLGPPVADATLRMPTMTNVELQSRVCRDLQGIIDRMTDGSAHDLYRRLRIS
ncbi:PREDICTED: monocarboxylate transporter 13-like [Priapulus caudatus]|uniref:Monocarboxylate transporter 13-like n=1 Tax=Priapulus caudatus TaxID=37621 RepID=A0ABM1EFN5_PRICU|nr:PREDICTED: monocarboxylate transporter 13-like [Priapulus caudatus]